MSERLLIEGNEALARAVKQCRPEVIAAYPITPSTPVVAQLGLDIDKGELDCVYVAVESEHSAMAALCAASAAGTRTFTATSSQGLAFMHEQLYLAAGQRLPIVMYVANRTLSAPTSLQAEHHDSLASRDSGWIQIYCASAQDMYDTALMAYRIAEDPRVWLPVMVCGDGFKLSHSTEVVETIALDKVKGFVPDFKPTHTQIDHEVPFMMGIGPTPIMEYRYNMTQAMENALEVIEEVGEEFHKISGRKYGLIDPHYVDDAEVVILAVGSMATTGLAAVKKMREEGKKVGLINLRTLRPFPSRILREIGSRVKAMGLIERNCSVGSCFEGGAMLPELTAAMYGLDKQPIIKGYVAGLGGRDITADHFTQVAEDLLAADKTDLPQVEWININY